MPVFFFFQAEDGIRDYKVTGVQTCALPIWLSNSDAWDLQRRWTPRGEGGENVRSSSVTEEFLRVGPIDCNGAGRVVCHQVAVGDGHHDGRDSWNWTSAVLGHGYRVALLAVDYDHSDGSCVLSVTDFCREGTGSSADQRDLVREVLADRGATVAWAGQSVGGGDRWNEVGELSESCAESTYSHGCYGYSDEVRVGASAYSYYLVSDPG